MEKLENVQKACLEEGSPDVIVVKQDLGTLEACDQALNETINHFKALDVLVNNAGVMFTDNLENFSEEHFDVSMNVNVKSALRLSQKSVEWLQASTVKSIVNVSSIAGLRAYPGSLPYKISKAAMDQMTRCTAIELAPKGIRVNSVNPGVIDTELFVKSGLSQKAAKTYVKEKAKKIHPLGRCGQPEEVAKVIIFLASEDASFICGQMLAIDGGRSVLLPY